MENRLLRLGSKKLLNIRIENAMKNAISVWYKKYKDSELEDEVSNYLNFENFILKDLLRYKHDDFKYEYSLDGRSVEFMILKDGEPYIAIELKGSKNKDLTKKYGEKYSAVEQASNYASKKSSIKWYIVSNYYEFRLYHQDSQNNYISFTLDDLYPDGIYYDKKRIQQFLTVFSRESVIEKDYITKIYDNKGLFPEDFNFENEFYKLYKETRLMLIKELKENNNINNDEAIEYAQLILNRYIFMCFCEDKELLPDDMTTSGILNPVQSKFLAINTIWNRLNGLFYFINHGNPENDITDYNGGLFKEDLNHLMIRDKIDDEDFYKNIKVKWSFPEQEHIIDHELRNYPTINQIYRNLLIISSFDFKTDLTENILGHIFENSISDIEELKNQETDEKKSKRKKDGIFYTPENITSYICENTIIPYLSNQNNNTIESLIKEYSNSLENLEERLHDIKIIDPACGSGAFLNKATDTLLAIHKAIFNFKHKTSENLDKEFDNIDNRREILLNNIHGVDLNSESIEITKLGLFLKVCKKGIKLPDLDKNIKCGNSLISDSEYTDRPFDWEKEFSKIIANGGFDVVIGNPPYIPAEFIKPRDKEYFEKNYNSAYGRINTYPLFYEKGLDLLKSHGMLGFITPYTLIKNQYYKEARKFILENSKLLELIDFKGTTVFQDAAVDSIIVLLKKESDKNYEFKQISDIISFENQQYKLELFNISDVEKRDDFAFLVSRNEELIDKINDNTIQLKEIIKFNQGIITGGNKRFLTNEKSNLTKPVITGSNFNRYTLKYNGQLIIYDTEKLHRPRKREIFEVKEKILLRQTGAYPICTLDSHQFYTLDTVHNGIIIDSNFEIKYILCLLNSKLIKFLYESSINESGKVFAQVKIIYVNPLPIKKIPLEKQNIFVDLTNQIMNKNKELHEEIESFHKYLISDFNVAKINRKLTEYHNLSFDDLYKEVKKQYKKITRKEKDKLEKEYFLSLDIILPLQKEIDNIDKEIDSLVYRLYELTDEEVDIIENSFI